MLHGTEPRLVLRGPVPVSDWETLEPSRSQALKVNFFHLNTSPILYSCVTLGKLLHFSEHLFPGVKDRDNNHTYFEGIWGTHRI